MSRIIQFGDKVYLLMPPNHKDDYRYVEGIVDEISNDIGYNKILLGHINLDQIGLINGDTRHLCLGELRCISIKVKYKTNKYTFINNKSTIHRLYTEDELDNLIEDVYKLNDILKVKRLHKQVVQEYINTKLENWNYRGDINA